MIAIVDYGVGNLHSVFKAVEKSGEAAKITSDAAEIEKAGKLILPGVGSFGHCMQNLEKYGLSDAVKDYAQSGRPFLGICVGLQILFVESEESPSVKGLGLLPGSVRRIPKHGLKIPQIGWNSLEICKPTPLFSGIENGGYVYFVHSYYVDAPTEIITARMHYGENLTASVQQGNIQAVQFHPEKSSDVGLKMLANFCKG